MASKLGTTVRRLREQTHLSQEELAGLAGISRSWLARIETGRIVSPKVSTIQKVADALKTRLPEVTVANLFEEYERVLPACPESADNGRLLSVTSPGPSTILDLVNRREFLARSSVGMVQVLGAAPSLDTYRLLDALRHPNRVNHSVLDDLEVLTRIHGRHVHTMSPVSLLPLVHLHLAEVRALLSAVHDDDVERRLLSLGGETAVIAGYLSYHLHNYGDAEECFALADDMAKQAHDGPLQAMGLVARSALYSPVPHGGSGGDPQLALTLLSQAEAAAGSNASPLLLTWLHCRRVEDFASCGEASASDRSLDLANSTFATVRGRDDGFYYNWTNRRLTGYQASAAVLLGRSHEAAATVEAPLQATTCRMPGERSFLLIILAAAHADQGGFDRGCELLMEALQLAKDAGLHERIRRIKGTRRLHLSEWATTEAVRELDARLLAA